MFDINRIVELVTIVSTTYASGKVQREKILLIIEDFISEEQIPLDAATIIRQFINESMDKTDLNRINSEIGTLEKEHDEKRKKEQESKASMETLEHLKQKQKEESFEELKMKEKQKIEAQVKAQALKIKQESELREMKAKAERDAKIEMGLIFGKWEMKSLNVTRQNPTLIPVLEFFNSDEPQIKFRYYPLDDAMLFIYPYCDEVKNYMKKIGMTWIYGGWYSQKWKADIENMAEHWKETEEWVDSTTFGHGKNRYEKTSTLKNIFDQAIELIPKIESITNLKKS
jgi:hypothetical protein